MLRSARLKDLRARGITDKQIVELGGHIQGLNVLFHAGEPYDRAAEILKLPPLPDKTRMTKFEGGLDEDERKLMEAVDKGWGDKAKELFEKIGADKVAKLYEKITGWECGCPARQKKWNELGRKVEGLLSNWWPFKKKGTNDDRGTNPTT